MFCVNSTSCLNGYRCISGYCIYSNEDYLDIDSNNDLTLPIIGAIVYDLPSLRFRYFVILLVLIFLGFMNNIFSLMTFIRDRIRRTICGIYLITYSICSLILMVLILINLITVVYYENYFFRLWACHGCPYLSLTMVYTSILISTAIAIEGLLNQSFNFDKFRSRKQAIIISILVLLFVSISNLDKIFARRLITDRSGHYSCRLKKSFYEFLSQILIYIYVVLPCLIHFVCLIWIVSIRIKKNCLEKIFHYQNHFIPSLFIILCLLSYGFYRYLFHFHFTISSNYQLRLHLGFLCLFYAPQIFTYMIYVLPDDFYVKQFYQIWFYRKLCCCFYNKQRHVQEFVVIHKLWARRTSLETIKTIGNLDDVCVESEFYKK